METIVLMPSSQSKVCSKIFALKFLPLFLLSLIFIQNELYGMQYEEKTIAFQFESNGDLLAGSLRLPKDMQHPPLLVFMPGSGNSSYRTNYKGYLDATLHTLVADRYALLNFDKPGIGKSSGAWWDMDFEALAKNAVDAIRYAKENFPIDPQKIGVIGHSQGGWLVQIIAGTYPDEIQFGISMAGSVTTVFEQDVQNAYSKIRCEGLDSLQAMERAVSEVYKLYTTPTIRAEKKNDLHYRVIKGYDPTRAIRNIQRPVLFLFGENDPLVHAQSSVDKLKAIFKGDPPSLIQWKILEGTDHSLYRIKENCFDGDVKKVPTSQELHKVMGNFIHKQFTLDRP
ncbi:alpha/beta hydrolase [Muricauda sp. NFXS6]|uniref:alpha/beta hydrolase family protein n=1 Tax=Allomuricauda sp. NFXS6 TaxID=2819094 RepID=UPI0032DE95F0